MNGHLGVNKSEALLALSFTGNGSGLTLVFVHGERCRAVFLWLCLADSWNNFSKYSYSDFVIGCIYKGRGGKGNH